MQKKITTNKARRMIFNKKSNSLYFQYGTGANWRKINLTTVKKYFYQNPFTKEWEPKKEFYELWFWGFFIKKLGGALRAPPNLKN